MLAVSPPPQHTHNFQTLLHPTPTTYTIGTFNGEGRCTSVPQLPEGQSLSSSRSCVTTYPTRTAEGLLWVWPDNSPVALIESADEAAWPGLAPELDEFGDRAFSTAIGNHMWYARCEGWSLLALAALQWYDGMLDNISGTDLCWEDQRYWRKVRH
jgi:hypothetical protein